MVLSYTFAHDCYNIGPSDLLSMRALIGYLVYYNIYFNMFKGRIGVIVHIFIKCTKMNSKRNIIKLICKIGDGDNLSAVAEYSTLKLFRHFITKILKKYEWKE